MLNASDALTEPSRRAEEAESAAEVPQRGEMEIEPINADGSQAEGIAGFASRGHGATNGNASLQARAGRERIRHDDVCAVRNDPVKRLGRVEAGQPRTVERGGRQMRSVTGEKWR
jgi:hypothetical protein